MKDTSVYALQGFCSLFDQRPERPGRRAHLILSFNLDPIEPGMMVSAIGDDPDVRHLPVPPEARPFFEAFIAAAFDLGDPDVSKSRD